VDLVGWPPLGRSHGRQRALFTAATGHVSLTVDRGIYFGVDLRACASTPLSFVHQFQPTAPRARPFHSDWTRQPACRGLGDHLRTELAADEFNHSCEWFVRSSAFRLPSCLWGF
jgi:hypothetical protein